MQSESQNARLWRQYEKAPYNSKRKLEVYEKITRIRMLDKIELLEIEIKSK